MTMKPKEPDAIIEEFEEAIEKLVKRKPLDEADLENILDELLRVTVVEVSRSPDSFRGPWKPLKDLETSDPPVVAIMRGKKAFLNTIQNYKNTYDIVVNSRKEIRRIHDWEKVKLVAYRLTSTFAVGIAVFAVYWIAHWAKVPMPFQSVTKIAAGFPFK